MASTNLPSVLENDKVKNRFTELLDKNAPAFISTLLTLWNGNSKLQDCDTQSILGAAGLAATLNLSIAPSLGYAHIVPYNGRATFQIGWKGIVQLAHRTGKYTAINSAAVFEGEIRGVDCITGELIRGEKLSEKVVGYVAYFRLNNGFEKALYMTAEEMEKHAQTYSKAYSYDTRNNKKTSVWSTNFDAMAKKTVLKLLISRWGILSSGLQDALQADQSIVNKSSVEYVDNSGDVAKREDYSQLDDVEIPFETVDAETGEILEAEK